MSLLSIGGIILSVLDKFFPNQTEIKKADLELKKAAIDAEVQLRLSEAGLLGKQADTNTAEAANPNRKWITWRELIGYACASALWYFWIIQPLMVFGFAAAGHPIDPKSLPDLQITDILVVVGGMLGVPLGQYLLNRGKK